MGGRGASRFGSSSKVGRPVFNTAKDLLGIDILPCVKGVAELAAKILDVSQQVQTNREESQHLARHVDKIVMSLAKAQSEQAAAVNEELQEDLKDISATLQDILAFLLSEQDSSRLSRLIRQDSASKTLKDFEKRLEELLREFLLRSQISVRKSQAAMAQRLEEIYHALERSRSPGPTPTPEPTADSTLLASEPSGPVTTYGTQHGIYQIVNQATGMALERGYDKALTLASSNCQSRRQLWSIFRFPRQRNSYLVRSLWDGVVLDKSNSNWVCVCSLHGGHPRQGWTIARTEGHGFDPYYTIQSTWTKDMVDTECEKLHRCSRVHARDARQDSLSQRWNFILLQPWAPHDPKLALGIPDPLFVQNRRTKSFLTSQNDHLSERNVSVERTPSATSEWAFLRATLEGNHQVHINTSTRMADNTHKYWEVVPCGVGSVILRNVASGRLLCHKDTGLVDTASANEYVQDYCQWFVTTCPRVGELPQQSIVYDTTLCLTSPGAVLRSEGDRTEQRTPTVSVSVSPSYDTFAARRSQELAKAIQEERTLYTRCRDPSHSVFIITPREVDFGTGDRWFRSLDLDELMYPRSTGEVC